MDDDGRFMAWFGPWRETRPDDTPTGWYSLDDLAAAFSAGRDAEHKRVLDEVLTPRRLEDLLRDTSKKD